MYEAVHLPLSLPVALARMKKRTDESPVTAAREAHVAHGKASPPPAAALATTAKGKEQAAGSSSNSASTKGKASARRASLTLNLKKATLPVRLFVALRAYWLAYLSALDTHPVMTKSLTAAVISIISDLLAQWLGLPAGKSFLQEVDWISVRNQAVIGFFIRGLPVHYWYMFLARLFRKYESAPAPAQRPAKLLISPRSPTTPAIEQAERGDSASADGARSVRPPLWVAAAKVFIDQTTYGVFFNWLYFFVIGLFNGAPLALTQAKVAKDFWPLMVANWKIWPLVSLLNFAFVPPNLQVLFGNVVSIFWTAYVVAVTR